LASLLLLCLPALPQQTPAELVSRMVQNELNADNNDHSDWRYLDSNTDKNGTRVQEVIQTSQGWLYKLVSVNGKPPSASDKQKSENNLHRMLTDSQYRKQQHEKSLQDGKKAEALLSMLPKAFLYKQEGDMGHTIRLSFQPNPNFDPPTREAKVFHGMAGTLTINREAMRLERLSGRLIQNVDFGWGILGRIYKGGTFEVRQADLGDGHWEITELDVHLSGHALFFATIKEQQHEVMTDFHQVPPGTTLAQAAAMLKEPNTVAANSH